ncbi:MAG: DNA recombination protein RmuC [Nitrospirae bacterium]|nr:DNA recombination protein RmuC [Nitrospirota bacterium]
MATAAYIISAMCIGGIVVWLFVSYRLKGYYSAQTAALQMDYSNKLTESEGRVKSAEAVNNELRQQIQQKDTETDGLRRDLRNEGQIKTEALTSLREAQKSFEEQKALIDVLKKEMTDTFNALSSAALKSSSEDFLRLASEHLGKVVADTKGKLGEHQVALDGTIKPLQEMLKKYDQQIKEIEEDRHKSFGSLTEQIRALSTMHERLQKETNNLVTALRKPQVSGSWGQMSLRRASELAGMTPYCDFYEQVSVSTESGRLRPDMIIRLPNGRVIVVDAKAPVDAYLAVASAANDEERNKAIANYIAQVRNHMTALGSKAYWDQFEESPEIVIMYLPGESFFSAAIEHDHKLIEDGSAKKVIVATPTTFIALLKAIAYGWQQEQMTKSAQEISRLGKELYERMRTMAGHFDDVGSAIEKAIGAYNKAVGSFESRVLPSVRRFRELGVTGADEIPILEQIDQKPRNLNLLPGQSREL